MLSLALGFELRSLLRNRARMLAVLAFLVVGVSAILVGQRFVSEWRDVVATAERAQEEDVDEAYGFLDRGEPGPADRPWINLTEPMWQSEYAAMRVPREPGPLAGIAAGAVDSAPATFHITAWADPLATGGYRIENPEIDAGGIDLTFVLAVLAPLLIGVLGIEIGGGERQEGIDRLVAVQAGESRRWLVSRMIAVAVIAGSATVALCILAGLLGGAHGMELGLLVGVAISNTIVWSGLTLIVNARAQSVRGAAFAFGMLWTTLCVLLPTLAAEVSLSRVEADFAIADTLDARVSKLAIVEREPESVLPELYARYPELEQLAAAKDEPLEPDVAGNLYYLLIHEDRVERHRLQREQERRAQAVSEAAAWLTPVVAVGLACERVAGVGPEAAAGYRAYLMDAVGNRVHWVIEKTWAKQPLGRDEFDALVQGTPPAYRSQPTDLTRSNLGPLLALSIWGLVCWIVALVALARAERNLARTV
ncbi:hypothetical protein G6O69_15240 [Pseudenhygromyxa sp. WMMC2535]|uniref:hypothetical protein n=1 Tax=Pseudenhygromyxa sp. WMMC2535 TaxID=2712867 RepID=UPI0015551E8A|nr:hypothetical protein [Pseudenhygromyxa sp. WMMC2535]NVB39196.1 hypothetical protein [Pseudenhygromyxa sp. WMMC2535]